MLRELPENFDQKKKKKRDENFKMQQKGAWPLDEEASRVNSKICFKRRPRSAKVQIVNTFDNLLPSPRFVSIWSTLRICVSECESTKHKGVDLRAGISTAHYRSCENSLVVDNGTD